MRGLKDQPNATPRQKVISEIMSGVERVRIDTERNFLDVLDRVNGISAETVDDTHIFTSRRSTKACCSRWARRATTADSSSPRARLPSREASQRSWTVERADIQGKGFDLKAVNPNAKSDEDTRTPAEILDIIEAKQKEISEAIAKLRRCNSGRGNRPRRVQNGYDRTHFETTSRASERRAR